MSVTVAVSTDQHAGSSSRDRRCSEAGNSRVPPGCVWPASTTAVDGPLRTGVTPHRDGSAARQCWVHGRGRHQAPRDRGARAMEIDGLHVEVVGDGVPTLVLHGGLGVDHTLYRASLDPLADELQLIYLDHLGNGRSARPDPATLTMAGWADDALHAGRAVAGNAPLNVIGHSYGGFVAQELAIRHPHAVGALVLI